MIHVRNMICSKLPQRQLLRQPYAVVLIIAITAAVTDTDKVVCAINPFPCCYHTHNRQNIPSRHGA